MRTQDRAGGKLKSGRGDGRRDQWNNRPRNGLFILPRNATASDTNRWLDSIKDWGSSELRHDLSELARPHGAGSTEEPEEPRRPNRDDKYENGDYVYEHALGPLFVEGGELTNRGKELYKEDWEIYTKRLATYEQILREIVMDKKKLAGKLEAQLSLDARTELERKYTNSIFLNKDPVALIDAIKTIFVGQLTGGAGNKVSRGRLRRSLDTISKASGESQVQYSRRFNDLIESYRHSELQAERDPDDLDAELSESKLTDLYVQSCGLQPWQWALEYNSEVEPYPETLEAAIKRAIQFEEGEFKKNRSSSGTVSFQQFQAFVAQFNKQDITVQQPSSSGNQGHSSETKTKPLRDANGVLICTSFNKSGTCKWSAAHPGGEPCKYSHLPPAQDNNKPPSQAAMTTAAVKAVGGVAFAPPPDQDYANALAKFRGTTAGAPAATKTTQQKQGNV